VSEKKCATCGQSSHRWIMTYADEGYVYVKCECTIRKYRRDMLVTLIDGWYCPQCGEPSQQKHYLRHNGFVPIFVCEKCLEREAYFRQRSEGQ